jgi:hypothetical protein
MKGICYCYRNTIHQVKDGRVYNKVQYDRIQQAAQQLFKRRSGNQQVIDGFASGTQVLEKLTGIKASSGKKKKEISASLCISIHRTGLVYRQQKEKPDEQQTENCQNR